METDYYSILDLQKNASLEDVKHAYRKLALQFHPDINPSPEAHERFIQITHAYEFLIEKLLIENKDEQSYEYNFDNEYSEIFNEIKKEARDRAQKYREMRKEAEIKRNEEFKKSGLYDLSLILRYGIHYLTLLIAPCLILFPVYISITQDKAAIFYLFYFWLVGIFLLLYIYSQRKTWFKLGNFYFKWKDILAFTLYKNNETTEDCQYCRKGKANGLPFKHSMLIIRDIQLKNRGPLQHDARYKRDYVEISVPRSRKAYFVHAIANALKLISLTVSLIFLPVESLVWRFILGCFAGAFLSTVLLLISSTKPKDSYLFNPTLIIKIIIWIGVILSVSQLYSSYQIRTSDTTLVVITLTAFFIDLFIDPLASLLFRKTIWKPVFKQPPVIAHYFELGYQNNLEIPVWSTIYPLLKWFF